MAVIIPAGAEIPTPAPGPRRYGVFDAVVRGPLDNRYVASGVQFYPEDCGVGVLAYDPTCAPPHAEKVFDDTGAEFIEADPYWLYASYQCGTVGTSAGDVRRRVQKRYNAGAQHAVETTMWTGAGLTGVPALTTAGAITVAPAGAGAGAAVAAAEQAFWDLHGYAGVLHVNTAAYAALAYAQMMTRAGGAGVFRTPLGTALSLGAGYGVTGPAGVAPADGFVWAFITPQTYVWSTEVRQPDPVQTLDRLANQWLALAETVYLHTWVCGDVVAVQIPVAAPAVATAPEVPA
ncbi:hypothetical protein ACFUGD_02625 [Streptomyces sp. NPDC057217]|uniref:hypothetical protein n=1 Tax=Streptomyces sp. NPDC057217 TaxID=3346054 RepID=UPI00363651EE